MIPDLGKSGQQQVRQIDIYVLIDQFFIRFMNSLLLNLFVSFFPKEQATSELDRLFDANLKMLEEGIKQIQINDLSLYIEIKKAIQISYDQMKLQIENSYKSKEKPAEEATENATTV